MIGRLNKDLRHAHIIGAGASGLFCAYALCKAGYRVQMTEASHRVGGMIRTLKSPYGLVEAAANSLVWTPELQALCDDIGIRLLELDANAKRKFILQDGKPRAFPLSIASILKMLVRAATVKAREHDPDVRSWSMRHLGFEVTERIIEPMVTGIYACPAQNLSLRLAFPRLTVPVGRTFLQTNWSRRSEKKLKRRVVAPEFGMESLFTNLAEYLKRQDGFTLTLGKILSAIPQETNVIIATPAQVAEQLLAGSHAQISHLLAAISYAPLVSIGVFLKKMDFARVPRGLGVLVPPAERSKVLGILYSSSSFAHRVVSQETILLTILLGGLAQKDVLTLEDADLKRCVQEALEKIWEFRGEVLEMSVQRWPNAIPIYSRDLAKILDTLKQVMPSNPGLVLTGSYAGEVSLRGMLHNAMQLAK